MPSASVGDVSSETSWEFVSKDEPQQPKATPFRFKAGSQDDSAAGRRPRTSHRHKDHRSDRHHARERDTDHARDDKRQRRHEHNDYLRPKPRRCSPSLPRRRRTPTQTKSSPRSAQDQQPAREEEHFDTHQAFAESLFDSLSDPEGAEYWSNVYGQPLDSWPREQQVMTDDEYADFVRAKMFERTNQGRLEEQARRQQARADAEKKQREERDARRERARHAADLQRQIDESLRAGAARRTTKTWASVLRDYETGQTDDKVLVWPVKSLKLADVSRESVLEFWAHVSKLPAIDDPLKWLKRERVRWHPDTLQRRFGSEEDKKKRDTLLAKATMVFQVLNGLFTDVRK